MRRVFVNPQAPHRDAVQEAAARIRRGGVVALPTDTLYALAADPFSRDAVARVFEAKNRPAERALPLIAGDAAQVGGVAWGSCRRPASAWRRGFGRDR